MGIVYNRKVGSSYKRIQCNPPPISRHRAVKALTPQSIQFLKSLGLQVIKKKKAIGVGSG